MAGEGYGVPGMTGMGSGSTVGNSNAQLPGMTAMSSNNTPTTPPATTQQPGLGAPPGLLQADNASSNFQLAAPTQGTDMMGTPSWVEDWNKAGSPDLNKWYQQQQGGYADMTKALKTPDQLVFAPPPPPPAAAAPAPAAPAAPAQQQGNWWSPKQGPAPAVTANSLWGSTPVDAATLDALPDAYVASQSFLNQYGSSPGAQAYQKWRMGPEAYFAGQDKQNALRSQMGYSNLNY